jgi:endonuclease/exonuclease/phosphatase (EEP) superfamily protein YafD
VSLLRPATWAPYLRQYRGVYAQRGDEADQIADAIAEETLPVVVAGDFNSTADNWSYHRLRTAGGVSRTDATQAVGGRAWGRTYHAERPFVRIDFVLADPALEVTAATTSPVRFSDHRPVRVGLRWRDAAAAETE